MLPAETPAQQDVRSFLAKRMRAIALMLEDGYVNNAAATLDQVKDHLEAFRMHPPYNQ